MIWLGLSYCGKTSEEVAIGMKTSLQLWFGDKCKSLDGSCVDSGQGTPESFGKACKRLEMVLSHTEDHSCGIHDTQSCFRLPIQKCIGTGGLDKENVIQFLHSIYSLYSELKECWSSMAKKAYLCITTNNNNHSDITVPKVLLTAIQEPLMTRWWSIGEIATVSSAYLFFFVKMSQAAANFSNSNDKVNVIASNIIRMSKSVWIMNDVHLVLAFTNSWLNKHMNWYQQNDCEHPA